MNEVANALDRNFTSPNVSDENWEAANIVDVMNYMQRSIKQVAKAITADGMPNQDAAGGTVTSLTEAMMGVTAGLCRIAAAIEAHTEQQALNN